MADRERLPTLDKRALLHAADPSPEKLRAQAELAFEDGDLYEALEFFERARDQEGLDRVRDAAIAEGDAGLLGWIVRNGLSQTSKEQWAALGEVAMNVGKYRFAVRAFEEAGDKAQAGEAREAVASTQPQEEPTNDEPGEQE